MSFVLGFWHQYLFLLLFSFVHPDSRMISSERTESAQIFFLWNAVFVEVAGCDAATTVIHIATIPSFSYCISLTLSVPLLLTRSNQILYIKEHLRRWSVLPPTHTLIGRKNVSFVLSFIGVLTNECVLCEYAAACLPVYEYELCILYIQYTIAYTYMPLWTNFKQCCYHIKWKPDITIKVTIMHSIIHGASSSASHSIISYMYVYVCVFIIIYIIRRILYII